MLLGVIYTFVLFIRLKDNEFEWVHIIFIPTGKMKIYAKRSFVWK